MQGQEACFLSLSGSWTSAPLSGGMASDLSPVGTPQPGEVAGAAGSGLPVLPHEFFFQHWVSEVTEPPAWASLGAGIGVLNVICVSTKV